MVSSACSTSASRHLSGGRAPSSPPAALPLTARGVSCFFWNQFSGGKDKGCPYPAWCSANSWFKERFASRWPLSKMQKLLWMLHLAIPSPNVLCKSPSLLFAPAVICCDGRLAQIIIASCLVLCWCLIPIFYHWGVQSYLLQWRLMPG